MTVAEAGQLIAVCLAAVGGIVIAIVKVFRPKERKEPEKKTSDAPPKRSCVPCNDSLDRLTDAISEDREARSREHTEEIREWRAFRELFVRWMEREEGRREAMRRTGEHQVAGV